MGSTRAYTVLPPWLEEPQVADQVWRVILATLGPHCDELWLRFGNLGEMGSLLPEEQNARLKELVGPYWGQPDPIAPPQGAEAALLNEMLTGLVDAFKQAGWREAAPPPSEYAPYGCAVVPLGLDLVDLLTGLTAVDPNASREMPSRLADHWHLRQNGRDVISTSDGMALLGLTVTPEELEAVSGALQAAGLDPGLLVERPEPSL